MRRMLLLVILLASNLFAGAAMPTVNSISALQSLLPGAYPAVQLLGYTSAGDGGGGVVNWVGGSTKAAAACSVYVPTLNPAVGRWERPASPFRLARQCGIMTMADTISGVVTYTDLAGSGTRMVVVSATGTTSTQSIPAGASLADPTGLIGLTVQNGVLTTPPRSDGRHAIDQAIAPTWTGVHTFTPAPVFSSVTASQVLAVNGSKALTSIATTGSGSVMLAVSPTTTGTLNAAIGLFSGTMGITGIITATNLGGTGTRMVVADATGVLSTQSIPSGGSLANPTGTIGLSAVNGSSTSGIRADGAPALSQSIVPTWSGIHTFTLAPIFSSVTASQVLLVDGSKALTSSALTGTGSLMRAASPTTTGTLTADAITAGGLVTGAGFVSTATASLIRNTAGDSVRISGGNSATNGMNLTLTGGSAPNNGSFSFKNGLDTVMRYDPNGGFSVYKGTFFTSNVTVIPNATLEVQYHLTTTGTALFTHGRTAATLSAVTETAGAIAINISNSDFYSITLDDNSTLSNPTNSSSGRHFTIRVRQDGTGGNTLGFGNTYRFPDGIVPDINTDANSVNYYSFIYDEVADKWDFIGNAFNLLPAGT